MIGRTNVGGGGAGGGFAAISVTYPVGSVCTCSKDGKVLKAKDTSGSFLFGVKEGGTWTITATNGEKTTTKTVEVEQFGTYTVSLAYTLYLFNGDNGGDNTEVTGGWGVSGWTSYKAGVLTRTVMQFRPQNAHVALVTNNKFHNSGFTKLHCYGNVLSTYQDSTHEGAIRLLVVTKKNTTASAFAVSPNKYVGYCTLDVDISQFIGQDFYVEVNIGYGAQWSADVYKVWFD